MAASGRSTSMQTRRFHGVHGRASAEVAHTKARQASFRPTMGSLEAGGRVGILRARGRGTVHRRYNGPQGAQALQRRCWWLPELHCAPGPSRRALCALRSWESQGRTYTPAYLPTEVFIIYVSVVLPHLLLLFHIPSPVSSSSSPSLCQALDISKSRHVDLRFRASPLLPPNSKPASRRSSRLWRGKAVGP
jgi:hypothetical protein